MEQNRNYTKDKKNINGVIAREIYTRINILSVHLVTTWHRPRLCADSSDICWRCCAQRKHISHSTRTLCYIEYVIGQLPLKHTYTTQKTHTNTAQKRQLHTIRFVRDSSNPTFSRNATIVERGTLDNKTKHTHKKNKKAPTSKSSSSCCHLCKLSHLIDGWVLVRTYTYVQELFVCATTKCVR